VLKTGPGVGDLWYLSTATWPILMEDFGRSHTIRLEDRPQVGASSRIHNPRPGRRLGYTGRDRAGRARPRVSRIESLLRLSRNGRPLLAT